MWGRSPDYSHTTCHGPVCDVGLHLWSSIWLYICTQEHGWHQNPRRSPTSRSSWSLPSCFPGYRKIPSHQCVSCLALCLSSQSYHRQFDTRTPLVMLCSSPMLSLAHCTGVFESSESGSLLSASLLGCTAVSHG